MLKYSPVDVARQFLFVHEAGENRGLRVEAIQHWSAGQFGDSYCCEFATMVLDIAFQGASPVPRLQACQDVYDLAKKNGWVTDSPSIDDLFLYVNDADHAHHIGIVTAVDPLTAVAGNTSPDGTSSEGTGVFEHAIVATVFVAYPR
jgi:hypothetical protein